MLRGDKQSVLRYLIQIDRIDAMSECLRVVVRPRYTKHGFGHHEYESILALDNNTHMKLLSTERQQHFEFDRVFGYDSTQNDVFQSVGQDIVNAAVQNGYNGTIFAYGQTCSGKTHTMVGPSDQEDCLSDPETRGIIPRSADFLFDKLAIKENELGEKNFKWSVRSAFVELYNEEYFDLLDDNKKVKPRVGINGVYLEGLSEMVCETSIDVTRVLQRGWINRRVAETNMNRTSSRSHAIFIIDLTQEEMSSDGVVVKKSSRINLVDLAGSERIAQTGAEGERLKEACNINQSLSVLSRVIRELAEKRNKTKHIPYRDSALTHFLKDSIGGNAKTAVVVCVHSEARYFVDTQSSLRFAAQCRLVKNIIHANEVFAGDSILALQQRIKILTQQLSQAADKERKRIEIEELLPLREKLEKSEDWRKVYQELRGENETLKLKLKLSRENFTFSTIDDNINIDKMLADVHKSMKPLVDDSETQALIDRNGKLKFELDEALHKIAQLESDKENSLLKTPMRMKSYSNVDSPFPRNGRSSQASATRSPSRKERRRTMYTPAEKVRESLFPRAQIDFDNEDDKQNDESMFAHLELAEQQLVGCFDEEQMDADLRVNQLEQVIKNREMELENSVREYNATIAELENNLVTIAQEKDDLKVQLCKNSNIVNEKVIELQNAMDTITHMTHQKQSLREELNGLNSKLFEFQEENETLRANAEQTKLFEKMLEENNARKKCAKDELDKKNREVDSLKNGQAEFHNKLMVANQELTASKEINSYLEKELIEKKQLIDELNADLGDLRNITSALNKKMEKDTFHRDTEVDTLRNRAELAEQKIQLVEKNKKLIEDQLRERVTEYERLTNELQEYKRTLQGTRDQLNDATAEVNRKETISIQADERVRSDMAEMKKGFEEKIKIKDAEHEADKKILIEQKIDVEAQMMREKESFQRRIEELRENFKEKKVRETMDHTNKMNFLQNGIRDLERRLEQLESEKELLEQKLRNEQEENASKEQRMTILIEEKTKADKEISEMTGQVNQNQKIKMMEKYRIEVTELKKEKLELQNKLNSALASLKKVGGTTSKNLRDDGERGSLMAPTANDTSVGNAPVATGKTVRNRRTTPK